MTAFGTVGDRVRSDGSTDCTVSLTGRRLRDATGIAAGWAAIGATTIFTVMFLRSATGQIIDPEQVRTTAITWAAIALYTPVAYLAAVMWPWHRKPVPLTLLVHFTGAVVFCWIVDVCIPILDEPLAIWRHLGSVTIDPAGVWHNLVIYTATIAAVWGREYVADRERRELQEAEMRVRLTHVASRATRSALKAGTLAETLRVAEESADDAQRTTGLLLSLADYLRDIVDYRDLNQISLAEEIVLAGKYIAVATRNDGSIELASEVSADALQKPMQKLALVDAVERLVTQAGGRPGRIVVREWDSSFSVEVSYHGDGPPLSLSVPFGARPAGLSQPLEVYIRPNLSKVEPAQIERLRPMLCGAGAIGMVLRIIQIGDFDFPFHQPLVLYYVVTTMLWIALPPMAMLLAERAMIRRDGSMRSLWLPGTQAVLALVGALLLQGMMDWHLELVADYPDKRFALHAVVAALLAVVTYMWGARNVAHERQMAALEVEGELAEAELSLLQHQLEPHFLFNALASATALAEEDSAAVRVMLRNIREFYTRVNEQQTSHEVPLSTELSLLDRYIAIERVRFGQRLQVELNVPDEVRNCSVPALMLQPLVENAIRHGIARRAVTGRVAISASRSGGVLRLTVINDNPSGVFTNAIRRMGSGLANTRHRLAHLYGDQHVFQFQVFSATTRVLIELPYKEAA